MASDPAPLTWEDETFLVRPSYGHTRHWGGEPPQSRPSVASRPRQLKTRPSFNSCRLVCEPRAC